MPSLSTEHSVQSPSRDPLMPLVEILQVATVAAILVLIGAYVSDGNPIVYQAVVWLAYVAMALVIRAQLSRRGQGWDHFGLTFTNPKWPEIWRAVWRSMVVFVAALAAFVLGSLIGAPLFGLPEQADFSGYNPLSGNLPLLLVMLPLVWLASSIGEELVFRGFLITRMAEWAGGQKAAWRIAVGTSAILFGFAHYAWGPTGILQTTLMGLALGISYLIVKRNLWVTILTHMYMDTLLLVPMYLAEVPPGG